MADENDVLDFLRRDAALYVANVGFKCNIFVRLMSPLADAAMGRSKHLMSHLAQRRRGVAVAPAAMPGAVNQNDIRHRHPPLICWAPSNPFFKLGTLSHFHYRTKRALSSKTCVLVVVVLDLHDLVAGRKRPAKSLDLALACRIRLAR